jgi:hypothetical protein
MDHYPSHALFMIGFSMEIPTGMAFLQECLNEAHLTDVNLPLCLVFSVFGIFIMCVGYIIKDKDKR